MVLSIAAKTQARLATMHRLEDPATFIIVQLTAAGNRLYAATMHNLVELKTVTMVILKTDYNLHFFPFLNLARTTFYFCKLLC